jgi:hypothetical protein
MASKRKPQQKDIPTVVKKNKATMSRTERKEEERKEELHIEEEQPYVFNDVDKDNIKYQIEHRIDAKMIGAMNSFLQRYAVRYRKTWLFVIYNRASRNFVGFIDISHLTEPERKSFYTFKERLELEKRIKDNPPKSDVNPVAHVKQVPPPLGVKIDAADDDFAE